MSKTIVITGTTSGVGLETSKRFLIDGWNVVGLARNSKAIPNDHFVGIATDIRDSNSVRSAFDQIKTRFGTINMLVNNASVFRSKPMKDFSISEIDEIIDTNLKGTIFCTIEAIKLMRHGRIVNIGSVSGTHGIENQAVYSASKYAINGFADSLNQELIRTGVKVTTICPGGIDTPLWNKDNKYDGDVSNLLKPTDLADMIRYISNLPDNVVLKTMTMFPTCEWH